MPKFNINMQWLIPVATAAWAVWTWATEHQRERKQERARLSALFVNPYLSACEELQSRIYNLLELGGLRAMRKRYPDGSYAEETLYLIVRYFGWMVAVERHGPYTQDPVVMRLDASVRRAFAFSSAASDVGPFNFFNPEQKALGKLIMTTHEGQHGVELDTISYYEFKERLTMPPLSDSESVKESLDALRETGDARDLAGRERLAQVQNHLVELLAYLEKKEGYTLFQGQRKKVGEQARLKTPESTKPLPAMSA
ncbi:MAG: hypothetical protein QNK18_09910 [Gammaproteobacteria bacterium]|nr:hypothetical protein [Gammaproteobacteria bacterium]